MKGKARRRLLPGLFCLIMILVSVVLTGCDQTERKYEKAQKLLSKGDYEAAEQLFQDVQGYEDANQYLMYTRALACAERGDYETAIDTFTSLSGFRDSDQQVVYYEGRAYQDADDFASLEKAREIYEEIVFFRDCAERIEKIDYEMDARYRAAIQLGDEGNYNEAIERLSVMENYGLAGMDAAYYYARYVEDYHMANNEAELENRLYLLREYIKLGEYRDAKERFNRIATDFMNEIKAGDVICYGDYDSAYWQVLDVKPEEKRLLVISRGLAAENIKYGYMNVYTTWEDSYIREWMNNEFFWELFGDGGEILIDSTEIEETVLVPNEAGDGVSIETSGVTTTDKLFALSVDEARLYSDIVGAGVGWWNYEWWLRDGGTGYDYDWGNGIQYVASYVKSDGSISYGFHNGYNGKGVCPAMWIDLNWNE